MICYVFILKTNYTNRMNLNVKSIHSIHHHYGWDNKNNPIEHIEDDEVIVIDTVDSSGGQLNINSKAKDINNLDFSKVNPVTGPLYIQNALPGDVLEIQIIDFETSGWGWTANIPGFGLLSDQFKEEAINIWKYDQHNPSSSLFSNFAKIPLKPFVGTIGLAPKEDGVLSVVPPRNFGGNLDIKEVHKGTKIYLPIQVKGALLSLGDTHAAQGDGEVCGTAIESPMKVSIKTKLLKNYNIKSPFIETNHNIVDNMNIGSFITTGIGEDLFISARESVMRMIDHLTKKIKITDVEAYMLCSVAGNLKISEIVDQPNWVVSFEISKSVFN